MTIVHTEHRRRALTGLVLSASAAVLLAGCANPEQTGGNPGNGNAGQQVVKSASSGPNCDLKEYGGAPMDLTKVKMGYSQSEKEDNPFRIASTASMKAEAAKEGIQLLATNAQSDLGKQISDIQSLLAQGVQFLVVSPLNSEGLEPALKAARDKNVPVITLDRRLAASSATPCKDYVTAINSDFVEQGKRAGEQLAKATGGTAKVAILLGSSGNDVTTDRTNGFTQYAQASAAGMQVVAQQTGDFTREKGQSVTEQLLQSHPEITAIYAENDEMALGAVTAIKSAGKQPGKDVKIVSIDGTRSAVQGIVDGEINGDVETNPRFGPLALQIAKQFAAGQPVPTSVIIDDKQYSGDNAKTEVANAY